MDEPSKAAQLLSIALMERGSVKFRVAQTRESELHLRVSLHGETLGWARTIPVGCDLEDAIDQLCGFAMIELCGKTRCVEAYVQDAITNVRLSA